MIGGVTIHDLPKVNATLNATSAVLLVAAYICIKNKKVRPHAWLMISAVCTSAAFLAGYLTYHAHVGVTRVADAFPAVPNWLRDVYLFVVLLPHTLLAAVMVPMIATSLVLAYRRKWATHRRVSPWSFWIWLYVSVSGVIIYWMLYHLFPGIQRGAGV
jgi:uncharacterized membrane protein YozB (DUF420 family)